MAGKRGASSDLNHDNWDQEDEPEVAGTFSQASQDELKTRVIRKAKRRVPPNGGEGQAGGVFSVFSGFRATAASANANANANAGASPASAAISSGGAFDFLKTDAPTSAPKWTCSTCMVPNQDKDANCVCCTTPKPGATSSTSAPVKVTPAIPSTNNSLSGFGGFGALNTKWTCDACMVPNKSEDDACVCCSTAKPGATPKSSATGSSSLGASAISMAPGGGFKFGGSSDATPSASTASGFRFGSSEVPQTSSTTSTTPLASGFKFGSPATTANETSAASAGAGGFKFGSSASNANAESKDSAKGFSFGANNAATVSNAESPAKTGFNFGSSSSVASSAMNNATPTSASSKATAYSDKYCHQLKCLNQQISEWIKKHVDENPFVLLTPIFADYDKYLQELEPLKSTNENHTPSATSAASSAPVEKPEARPFQTTPVEKTSETARPLLGAVFGKKPEVFAESESATSNVPAYNPSPNASFSFAGPSSATSTSMTGPKMMFSFGNTSVVASVASTSSISSIPSASTFSFSGSKSSTASQGDKSEQPAAPPPSSGGLFSFGSTSSTKTDDSSKSLFTFGSKPAGSTPSFGSTASSGSGFSFGNSSAQPKTTSGFSFGSTPSSTPASGFSFATAASTASAAATASATAANNADAKETEESDEPPKVEVKTVEEEGSKYSIRCKLFYKSGAEFKEKGLGMLHLKDVDDGKKTQMVVRAETNLGNILLNILLTDKLNVTQRANNIQFVCVPNPEIKGLEPGPVSMLAKVKTADLAKELAAKVSEAIEK